VTVKKGEVTLQGQVGNRQDKRRAEECAEMCAGVVDVQNNIKIRSATSASSKGTA
jgi:osmotically-inducible protein OsmY